MNALVNCKYCKIEFTPFHFNTKCCSEVCRKKCRSLAIKKYKASEKGALTNDKWIKSQKRSNNEICRACNRSKGTKILWVN